MRILHVATFQSGGAGAAAFRLHRAMVMAGMQSRFLSFEQHADASQEWYSFSGPHNTLSWRLRHRWYGIWQKACGWWGAGRQRQKLQQLFQVQAVGLQAEYISLPFAAVALHKHPLYKWADVVHLHWVATGLDYPAFFEANKKPVIWTLHDLNPVLGIFHYPADEQHFGPRVGYLNRQVAELKRQLLHHAAFPLAIVAPSAWFRQYICNTGFPCAKVFTIPYTTPQQVFHPQAVAGLQADGYRRSANPLLLVAAAALSNYRKGFDIFTEALALLGRPVEVVAIGSRPPEAGQLPAVHYTGYIGSEQALAAWFALADAVVIPSREDNLPNIMLEALCCGTPVLGFRVGGLIDHIHEAHTGLLATEIQAAALARTMETFLATQALYNRSTIRAYAEAHFGSSAVLQAYGQVFASIHQKPLL